MVLLEIHENPMHMHMWHLIHDIILALPDEQGYREKLLTWMCNPCGKFTVITGSFSLHSGPVTLPDLEARMAQEQREGTALVRVAAREAQQERRGKR